MASRGRRKWARRRVLLSSQGLMDGHEAKPALSVRYMNECRAVMNEFDRLPPLWRALINFFGAAVVARVNNCTPEDVPRRLGMAAEFAEYYAEAYGAVIEREVQVKRAEEERIASAWDGIL